MLNVVKLSVVMPSAMAPTKTAQFSTLDVDVVYLCQTFALKIKTAHIKVKDYA
jgi:hypothetical protein